MQVRLQTACRGRHGDQPRALVAVDQGAVAHVLARLPGNTLGHDTVDRAPVQIAPDTVGADLLDARGRQVLLHQPHVPERPAVVDAMTGGHQGAVLQPGGDVGHRQQPIQDEGVDTSVGGVVAGGFQVLMVQVEPFDDFRTQELMRPACVPGRQEGGPVGRRAASDGRGLA